MVVSDLQVVLRRDGLGVADPLTDDVHGEVFGEFRLPRATKVLEQLGPGLQTGPLDDPKKLSPQIGIRFPVSSDDILGPWFGQIEALFQVRPHSSGNRGTTRDSPPKCPGISQKLFSPGRQVDMFIL